MSIPHQTKASVQPHSNDPAMGARTFSTAFHSHHNVCFTSSAPGATGRTVAAIGLIDREVLGWALNISDGTRHLGDARRADHEYDNYDSFSALTAAQICWT